MSRKSFSAGLAACLLLAGAPSRSAEKQAGTADDWQVTVRAIIVGGMQFEAIFNRQGEVAGSALADDREDRFVTLALSRFGLSGQVGEHVSFQSEFEVNAGPHGTSVWEGQAALQIRNQLLRLSWLDFTLDLGRITDPASVDFTSDHVEDQLLMDSFTWTPLLEAGYNRGNGLLAGYRPLPGLQIAVTFNAANPTSMTGGYLIAGKFANGLFSRFYRLAGQRIADSPNKYPDDAKHLMMLSPSVTYRSDLLEAQLEAQMFWANIDTNVTTDDTIFGYNLRAGIRGRLLDDLLAPFFNFSRVTHNTLDYQGADATRTWEGQDWKSMVLSCGVDVNYRGKNGVGIQYSWVDARQGAGQQVASTQHYINLGTTFWITDTVAVGARVAFWLIERDDLQWNSSRFEWENLSLKEGERSYYLTVRKVL